MKGERELCRNLGKECCSRGNSKYKGLRQKSRCLTCLRNKAEASTAEIEWKGEYKDNKAKETLRSQITWGLEGQASPHNQTHCFLLVLLVGMLQPPQGLCTCCVLFSGSFLVFHPPRKHNVGRLHIFFPINVSPLPSLAERNYTINARGLNEWEMEAGYSQVCPVYSCQEVHSQLCKASRHKCPS